MAVVPREPVLVLEDRCLWPGSPRMPPVIYPPHTPEIRDWELLSPVGNHGQYGLILCPRLYGGRKYFPVQLAGCKSFKGLALNGE